MNILVDSNVLLDLATEDPTWQPWSEAQLSLWASRAVLVINPVIFAEVSIGFVTREKLDEALPEHLFHRQALPYTAAFLAGRAFLAYRRRGGNRSTPLPDFYIGAHAAAEGLRLLTRDPKPYRTYFPRVELVCPP